MLNGLRQSDTELLSEETCLYLRDVADHATMAVDVVETLREMVSSLMDLYLSSISNRMNEIMKVLTIIATIFIPLSFVAGLYGMNFDPTVSPFNMPELGWYWGYPVALGVMALVAVGLLVFFRRRGWI
jgi:magnesium transporter